MSKNEQEVFFTRLHALNQRERATLRQEVGRMLLDASCRATELFYRCLPDSADISQADRWFAAACIDCLCYSGQSKKRPIEQVIADVIRRSDYPSIVEHRVTFLLDDTWDEQGTLLMKLRGLLKLIYKHSDLTQIDVPLLLDDFLSWDSKGNYVQRKWARAIFRR